VVVRKIKYFHKRIRKLFIKSHTGLIGVYLIFLNQPTTTNNVY